MRWLAILGLIALVLAGSGCVDQGPTTFQFAGPLDRALTEEEAEEVRRVAGKDFDVESTLIGCSPEVDPYDCNTHWLRVDGLTEAKCAKVLDALEDRPYWRRPPVCDEPG